MILGMVSADIGESDPHWASVVSLLSFEEGDGATTYTDAKGLSWTTTGGHAQSHDHARFGSGSVKRGASWPSYIETSHSSTAIAANQDCTIECWVRPDATSNRSVFSWANNAELFYVRSNDWALFSGGANQIFGGIVTTNVWTHVAVVRSSGAWRYYIAGAQSGAWTSSVARAAGLRIGDFNPGNPAALYVDEFRMTVGVARYTSAFTPRTTRFPRR